MLRVKAVENEIVSWTGPEKAKSFEEAFRTDTPVG